MAVEPHLALVSYSCKLSKPSTHDVCYQGLATAAAEQGDGLTAGSFITAEMKTTDQNGVLIGTHEARFFRYNSIGTGYARALICVCL